MIMLKIYKKSKGNVQKNNHKENKMLDVNNNNMDFNTDLNKKLPTKRELKKQKKQNDKILKLIKDIQKSYEEIERINEYNKTHTNDLVSIAEKENQKQLKSYDFAKWLATRILLSCLFGLLFFLGFNYLQTIEKPEIVVKCECENYRRDAINNNTKIYTSPQNQKDKNNE